MGSIRAARRAGSKLASNAMIVMAAVMLAKTSGIVGADLVEQVGHPMRQAETPAAGRCRLRFR